MCLVGYNPSCCTCHTSLHSFLEFAQTSWTEWWDTNELAARTRQTRSLLPQRMPSVSEAVALREDAGGHLVRESTYRRDPIESYAQLQNLRARNFFALYQLFFRTSCIITKAGHTYLYLTLGAILCDDIYSIYRSSLFLF